MSRLHVADIAARVRSGALTADAVTKDVAARILAYEAIQPEVWISRFDAEQLAAQGRAIDARLAAGEVFTLVDVREERRGRKCQCEPRHIKCEPRNFR